MRIGILGGTFDPIHRGHLRLAEEARKKLLLDRVFFVPAYLAPNKAGISDKITPAGIRYAMVFAAVRKYPSFKVLDVEIRKKRKVFTIETLRQLRRKFPGKHEFFLLTGGDNLSILDTWRDVRGIMRLARFVIARRPGYRKERVPPGIVWLPIRSLKVSASKIRTSVKAGRSVRHWVPREVETFIREKGLYRSSGGKGNGL
ncbi:MAG TPA: nicotinate-nucleotide adenylyltransferase [Candidatus Omnitrophota bacterium]|nr:nicotinate-nucleotide adenylyltransferase [Candidatus Omnitrophota bacterium]